MSETETVNNDNLIDTNAETSNEEAEETWQTRYLSDDLKENATLQKFKDVGSLSSSYLSMQEMLGSRIKMPSEESSEDEVNDFYSKLGRPESPDKYDISVPTLGKEGEYDQSMYSEFLNEAHKNGLTNKQAQAAIDFYSKLDDNQQINTDAAMAQAKINAETALKKEWGNVNYDKNLALSRRAFNRFADDDLKTFVNQHGIANNVAMIKFLHKIGKAFNEPEMVGAGKDSGSIDSDSAKIEMDAILKDPKHKYHKALFDTKDSLHEEAVSYRDHLYDIVYGVE